MTIRQSGPAPARAPATSPRCPRRQGQGRAQGSGGRARSRRQEHEATASHPQGLPGWQLSPEQRSGPRAARRGPWGRVSGTLPSCCLLLPEGLLGPVNRSSVTGGSRPQLSLRQQSPPGQDHTWARQNILGGQPKAHSSGPAGGQAQVLVFPAVAAAPQGLFIGTGRQSQPPRHTESGAFPQTQQTSLSPPPPTARTSLSKNTRVLLALPLVRNVRSFCCQNKDMHRVGKGHAFQ